jgi:hypothetical protein
MWNAWWLFTHNYIEPENILQGTSPVRINSTDTVVFYLYAGFMNYLYPPSDFDFSPTSWMLSGSQVINDSSVPPFISETLSFSDMGAVWQHSTKVCSDNLTFSDAAAALDLLTRGYRLSHPDRQAGTDFGFCNKIKTPSCKAFVTDALNLSAGEYAGLRKTLQARADTISFSDSASALTGIREAFHFTDDGSTKVLIAVTDTLAFSESISGGFFKRALDFLTFVDTDSVPFQQVKVSDGLSMTDEGTSNSEKAHEGFSLSDSALASVKIAVSERLGFSDVSCVLITLPAAIDGLSFSDSAAVPGHRVIEALSLLDFLTVGTPTGVHAHITDQYSLGFSDSAKATVKIAAADSFTMTDMAQAIIDVQKSEGLSLSDVWTVGKVSAPYATAWS